MAVDYTAKHCMKRKRKKFLDDEKDKKIISPTKGIKFIN